MKLMDEKYNVLMQKIFHELDDVFLFNDIDQEMDRFFIMSQYQALHQSYLTVKHFDRLKQILAEDKLRQTTGGE